MDTLGDNAWRMIELGHAELVTRLTGFDHFPALFRLIMLVKNLALEMDNRIEETQSKQTNFNLFTKISNTNKDCISYTVR